MLLGDECNMWQIQEGQGLDKRRRVRRLGQLSQMHLQVVVIRCNRLGKGVVAGLEVLRS